MTDGREVVFSVERKIKYACECGHARFLETGIAAGKTGVVRTPDNTGRVLTCAKCGKSYHDDSFRDLSWTERNFAHLDEVNGLHETVTYPVAADPYPPIRRGRRCTCTPTRRP